MAFNRPNKTRKKKKKALVFVGPVYLAFGFGLEVQGSEEWEVRDTWSLGLVE